MNRKRDITTSRLINNGIVIFQMVDFILDELFMGNKKH
jgi:hypothetical protein